MLVVPTRRFAGLFRQLWRFGMVGALNVAIDLVSYNLLLLMFPTRDSVLLVVLNTLAILVSMGNSWVLNSRWTFSERTSRPTWDRRRAKLFFGVQYAVGIVVNDAGIVVLTNLGRHLGYHGLVLTNGAKIASIAASCCFSFLMMRFAVFASRPAEPLAAVVCLHSEERSCPACVAA